MLDISGGGTIPIYMRVAQWLEDCILDGSIHGAGSADSDSKEDERIYSQYQLAEMFNINPATAAKGLNLLADEGTVYKKRGLGMFVSPDARKIILEKRRGGAFTSMARQLVIEAKRLEIDEDKLVQEIRHIYESGAGK